MNTNNNSVAWYREPWLWFVLAPIILVMITSSITVSIAFRTADDVVVDDYYREGRMLTQDYTADEYASSLGLKGQLRFEPGKLAFQLNNEAFAQDLVLLISHPAKAALDHTVELRRISPGNYHASYRKDLTGRWYLRLSAHNETSELWRMHGEIDFSQTTQTQLN